MEIRDVIKVAYAEDHPAIVAGVQKILADYSFILFGPLASNGREMLEMLEAQDELPDICMIDISMPVMDGFGLQKELKTRWPKMKTLIFTVYDNEPYIAKMLGLGANGYLLKNAKPTEIVDAICSIYKCGYYYNDIVDGKRIKTLYAEQCKPVIFSSQELEVLNLANTELSYAEMAARLNITLKSIEGTRYRLFQKLNINNRMGLAKYAKENGFGRIDNPEK